MVNRLGDGGLIPPNYSDSKKPAEEMGVTPLSQDLSRAASLEGRKVTELKNVLDELKDALNYFREASFKKGSLYTEFQYLFEPKEVVDFYLDMIEKSPFKKELEVEFVAFQNEMIEIFKKRLDELSKSSFEALLLKARLNPFEYRSLERLKENPDILRKLQEQSVFISQIEQQSNHWRVKLSPLPAIAEIGVNNPRDEEGKLKIQFEHWISKHEKEDQGAIRAIAEAIDYVDFEQFLFQLNLSIDHLNKKNLGKYLILVSERKSNKWVAELALLSLMQLPVDVIYLGKEELKSALQRHPDVDHIVLFDDASYSGEQMSQHLKKVIKKGCLEVGKSDFFVHLVIPYLTVRAKEKIKSVMEDVDFAPHHVMKRASDQVDEKYHPAINRIFFPTQIFSEKFSALLADTDFNGLTVFEMIMNGHFYNELKKIPFIEEFRREVSVVFGQENQSVGAIFKDVQKNSENYAKNENLNRFVDAFFEPLQAYFASKKEYQDVAALLKIVFKEASYDRGADSRTYTVFDHKVADHFPPVQALSLERFSLKEIPKNQVNLKLFKSSYFLVILPINQPNLAYIQIN